VDIFNIKDNIFTIVAAICEIHIRLLILASLAWFIDLAIAKRIKA